MITFADAELSAFEKALQNFFKFDIAPEVFSSLLVMVIMLVLAVIIGIQAHFQDPLKKPKGLLLICEIGVNFFDRLVFDLMGPHFKGFGGTIMGIATYLFLSFMIGLTGLPSPVVYLATPLSLGLITFGFIHFTNMKYAKWGYFKRYIDPIPIFLPINLISMWAPLLSLTMRLFGNAISGWTLMTLVYWAFENLSNLIIPNLPSGFAPFAPFITPILYAYFDIFSGFIQTTVFIFLTMIFVAQEGPEDIAISEEISKEGGR
jgi:F-type H+-transporting ATPase subunit a